MRASQLCERVLNRIHDLPASVTKASEVTPANGDLWLSSAASAFASLAIQLDGLKPPPSDLARYGQMTSELKAASVSFAAAKNELDANHRAAFARDALQAATHAGKAAGIGKALRLGQCGP